MISRGQRLIQREVFFAESSCRMSDYTACHGGRNENVSFQVTGRCISSSG